MGTGTDVRELNPEEPPGDVIVRLARESDAAYIVSFVCSSELLAEQVRGFFVLPRGAMLLDVDPA